MYILKDMIYTYPIHKTAIFLDTFVRKILYMPIR